MSKSEPGSSEFWESRYVRGETGWDRGGPSEAFVALLSTAEAPAAGTVAVPGCGTGHDALLFAEHGFHVTGFDFAPTAIARASDNAERAGLTARATFELADVFNLPAHYAGTFDYVLERACFPAIQPEDRPRYWRSMVSLLKPNGQLIGLFFVGEQSGGPPFAVSSEALHAAINGHFTIELERTSSGGGDRRTEVLLVLKRR